MAYPDSFPDIRYASGGDIMAITEVRRHLNEPAALDFTDTQIRYWLDRGAAEAARLTKLLEGGAAYITLATATSIYSYPTALYTAPQDIATEIESLFYCGAITDTKQTAQSGYALEKVDMRTIAHLPNTTAGPPSYWAERSTDNNSRSLYIYPAPAAGQNGFMVEVLFYKAAQIYATYDTGVHTLPEYLRETVIWYAVAEAYRKKRLHAVAEMYEQVFQNLCLFHRMDNHPKPVDSKDMMTTPDYTQFQ